MSTKTKSKAITRRNPRTRQGVSVDETREQGNASGRSSSGAIVRARPRRLTKTQINCIVWHLHDNIQFYDSTGKPGNRNVLEQIEAVLKRTRFYAP